MYINLYFKELMNTGHALHDNSDTKGEKRGQVLMRERKALQMSDLTL